MYTPEAELAIDESMIRYHGKSSLTVYVKNKPIQCYKYLTNNYCLKGDSELLYYVKAILVMF